MSFKWMWKGKGDGEERVVGGGRKRAFLIVQDRARVVATVAIARDEQANSSPTHRLRQFISACPTSRSRVYKSAVLSWWSRLLGELDHCCKQLHQNKFDWREVKVQHNIASFRSSLYKQLGDRNGGLWGLCKSDGMRRCWWNKDVIVTHSGDSSSRWRSSQVDLSFS